MKLRCRRGTALSTLLVGCALIAPGMASAESSGALSPELEQLATPTVQAQSPQGQAETLGFPSEGPGSLEREGNDVTVEVSFEEGALAALPALEEAGAEVLVSSTAYQLVTVRVDPADLPALAEVPGVVAVEPVRQPTYAGVESPQTSVGSRSACEGGSVLTEGLDQLQVVSQPNEGSTVRTGAREAFGVRGAGVTVGVLSNSFDSASTIRKQNVETKEFEEIAIPTHAAEDIQTADLPGPEGTCSGQQTAVKVLQEGSPEPPDDDEGRAMLQIVHDIAPHAGLAFATAAGGELNMAHNIEQLAAPVSAGGAGANVIVDDVTYPEEPMFQDGPIAAAINKVTAAGVTYVSAAGNNNFPGPNGSEIGSWEIASFKDTAKPAFCPIPVGVASRHCLDFQPGVGENSKFEFTIEQSKPVEIALGWSEPEYGLKSDLDLYLLREVPEKKAAIKGETEVVAEDKSDNILNGKPAAYVQWTNPEPEPYEAEETEGASQKEKEEAEENAPAYKNEKLFVVVNRCVGNVCDQSADPSAMPRTKMIFLAPIFTNPIQKTQYETSSPGEGIVVGPTIFGHAGDPSAVTVGASFFTFKSANEPPDETAINYAGVPDVYSSHGPVTHYWAPVNGTTPAAAVSPEVISKPNVVATDCNANTFYTNATFFLGFWRFCGTSAAAPHVAAIAALMKQASPSQSPAGIRTAIAESAVNPKGFGSNIVGSGLVQARVAIEKLSNRVTVNDPPSTLVAPIPPTPPTPPTPPAPTPEESETASAPAPTSTRVSNATGGEAKSSGAEEKESGKTIRTLPTTIIRKHPPKLVKSPVGRPKLNFTFASDQKGAKFECSVDGGKWSTCAAKYRAPFTLGPHELKVRARMSDGGVDKTPAIFKFKVQLVA